MAVRIGYGCTDLSDFESVCLKNRSWRLEIRVLKSKFVSAALLRKQAVSFRFQSRTREPD